MIADLRHPTRKPALEIVLRLVAVVITGLAILALLPAVLELAA